LSRVRDENPDHGGDERVGSIQLLREEGLRNRQTDAVDERSRRRHPRLIVDERHLAENAAGWNFPKNPQAPIGAFLFYRHGSALNDVGVIAVVALAEYLLASLEGLAIEDAKGHARVFLAIDCRTLDISLESRRKRVVWPSPGSIGSLLQAQDSVTYKRMKRLMILWPYRSRPGFPLGFV
jgi:hypothetical protein